MTTDPLDLRFPAGRRVVWISAGVEGEVIRATPTNILVRWDNDMANSYDADWFVRNPTALRLLPNIAQNNSHESE